MTILNCERLTKTYGGQVSPALADANLTLMRGEVLVVAGPNGAGKSTLFQIVAGALLSDRGSVSVEGRVPSDGAAYQRLIGAILDSGKNVHPRLTPVENAIYAAALKDVSSRAARDRAMRLFERLLPADKLNQPAQKLSRGMQQKVSIVCGVIHDPSLVILDEPTLGLDIPSTEALTQLIQKIRGEGKAVLIATHQLDFATRIADRVAIMERGYISDPLSQDELRSKSRQEYKVTLEGEVDDQIDAGLAEIPSARRSGTVIYVTGGSADLYSLFDIVRPRKILSVEKNISGLSGIVGMAAS